MNRLHERLTVRDRETNTPISTTLRNIVGHSVEGGEGGCGVR